MASSERREHERLDIEMVTRLFIDERVRGKDRFFEGFSTTKNISIGGCFLSSEFLLPVGYGVDLTLTTPHDDLLEIRGEVSHWVDDGPDKGMGVRFTAIDAENRERLLRFFVSDRIKDFYYERFVQEFPHLENVLTLKDVALTINLWEDREGRLTALGKPDAEQKEKRRR